MKLSPKFEEALQYAASIHSEQMRKGTEIPYVSHLLGVASIALEYGADEDEAIGALLHDAGEDAGGQARIDDIRKRFGRKVAAIVLGCTDTLETPKPDWLTRKKKYIAHIPKSSGSVRLVSAADKLHNARSILRDYLQVKEKLWSRFTAKKEGVLWYYRQLVAAFRKSKTNKALVDELDSVVKQIEKLSRGKA